MGNLRRLHSCGMKGPVKGPIPGRHVRANEAARPVIDVFDNFSQLTCGNFPVRTSRRSSAGHRRAF